MFKKRSTVPQASPHPHVDSALWTPASGWWCVLERLWLGPLLGCWKVIFPLASLAHVANVPCPCEGQSRQCPHLKEMETKCTCNYPCGNQGFVLLWMKNREHASVVGAGWGLLISIWAEPCSEGAGHGSGQRNLLRAATIHPIMSAQSLLCYWPFGGADVRKPTLNVWRRRPPKVTVVK